MTTPKAIVGRAKVHSPGAGGSSVVFAKISNGDQIDLTCDQDPTDMTLDNVVLDDPGLSDGVGFTLPSGFTGRWFRFTGNAELGNWNDGVWAISLYSDCLANVAGGNDTGASGGPLDIFSHAIPRLSFSGVVQCLGAGVVRMRVATDCGGGSNPFEIANAYLEIEEVTPAP